MLVFVKEIVLVETDAGLPQKKKFRAHFFSRAFLVSISDKLRFITLLMSDLLTRSLVDPISFAMIVKLAVLSLTVALVLVILCIPASEVSEKKIVGKTAHTPAKALAAARQSATRSAGLRRRHE